MTSQPEPDDAPLPGMTGKHPSMREFYREVRLLAPSDLPVLLQGETGTGKELVARAIHALSTRARGPFIDVNCGAIPESLAEGELFGADRGAYTDARDGRTGLLELANRGTLFLDEAAYLPTAAQVKLLRAIDRGEFRRVGGTLVKSDFRVVVATSRPMAEQTREGSHRPEFYFRIAGAVLTLPPLRQRGADMDLIAQCLLKETTGGAKEWTDEALAVLHKHDWPGNVRELRMVVRRLALLTTKSMIQVHDVGKAMLSASAKTIDREQARIALDACNGNISKASRMVGVPRSTFRDYL